jgi:hypothetical protein
MHHARQRRLILSRSRLLTRLGYGLPDVLPGPNHVLIDIGSRN